MTLQRGQLSRQSPACRFDVGRAGPGTLQCPPYCPWGRLSLFFSCPGHLLKWHLCGAGGRDTSFPSGALRPGERRRARDRGAPPVLGTGRGTGWLSPRRHRQPRATAAALLKATPLPCAGTHWDFFPSGKEQRLAKKALGRSKWHFIPKCEKRRANPLPLSVLLGRAGERSSTKEMEGDGGNWGQPTARRCRSPLPVGPAGVAGAAGARGPLRSPGLRGLFNPPIAETLTRV